MRGSVPGLGTLAIAAALVAGSGCAQLLGFNEPSAASATFTLAAAPGSVILPQGGTAAIAVTVTRSGAAAPIAVTVTDLPTGVTADPLTVPAEQTGGTLTLHAPAFSASDARTTATISGAGGGATQDAALTVTLAGPSGTLDSTFGQSGVVADTIGIGEMGFSAGLAVMADGRVVVAGSAGQNDALAVARYTIDGLPDPSFGGGEQPAGSGHTLVTVAPYLLGGQNVLLQPDGKIVVLGFADGLSSDVTNLTLVARFAGDGTPDESFGNHGIAMILGDTQPNELGGRLDPATVGIEVLSGNVDASSAAELQIIHVTSSGVADASFGSAGIVTVPLGAGQSTFAAGFRADGSILVTTTPNGAAVPPTIVALTSAGQPIGGFGTAGRLPLADFALVNGAVSAFVEDPPGSGKTLFAVEASPANVSTVYLGRMDANGVVDTTFGFGNSARPLPVLELTRSIVLDAKGQIVIGGIRPSGGDHGLALLRFSASGVQDSTFGPNHDGLAVVPPLPDSNALYVAVEPGAPGRIVVIVQNSGTAIFTLARYWP